MGFKVGMPVLKLVTGKGNGKRSANYRKILQEMGNERYSKSKTLDRTRSGDNVYMGFRAGKKCAEAIDDVLSTYRVRVHKADGTVQERAMKSNQIIGYSWVLKPPAEVTADWDDATWQKFRRDSLAVLEDICPELFGGCSELDVMSRTSEQHADTGYGHNLMMVSEHNDEDGRHLHGAGMPWTPDGRLCGKEVVCLPTFRKLNRTYPQRMQELGWDVEELHAYDEAEAEKDPEYKARHIAEKKAKKHGQSVNDYAAQKAREEAEAATEARIAQEQATLQAMQRELASTQAAIAQDARTSDAKTEQQAAEKARDAARTSTAQAKRERMAAEQKRDRALAVIEAYEGETYYTTDGMSHRGIKGVKKELQRLEDEEAKARQDAEDTRVAADNYRTAMVAAMYENPPTRAELEYEQAYETMLDEAQVLVDVANEANAAADEWLETHRDESDPSKHVEDIERILAEVPNAIGAVEAEEHGERLGENLRDFFVSEWKRHVVPFVKRIATKIAERVWPTPEQQAARERLAYNRELARAAQDAIDHIKSTQRHQTQRKAPKPQPQRTMIQNAPRRRPTGHGGRQMGS